ncbi:hypothetical protein AGMMS49546_07950 [Spirochaetia bacterium]|nr:hypothetical protein AGMMS49546_07950 [Spirochaetia bacterium]
MRKGLFILILVMVFFSSPLSAQNSKPLIRMMPLFVQGIGAEEERLIESLIQSYLSDFGEVISYTPGAAVEREFVAAANIPAEPETRYPDYIFAGSIYLERDNFIFLLEIGTAATGESKSFTMTSKSIGELVLKARSMVETAFSTDPERVVSGESLSLDEKLLVMKTWRGEPGIPMIRFERMGRGLVFFSTRARMAFTWTIEDNILKVRQVSLNEEGYYYPLPGGVAKQLAAEAEPMVWELRLYNDGNTLRGLKTRTWARHEGEKIIELIPKEILNVEWTRSGR